jgi:hypothetical protein
MKLIMPVTGHEDMLIYRYCSYFRRKIMMKYINSMPSQDQ